MLEELLLENKISPTKVIQIEPEQLVELNLSKNNKALAKVDLNDEKAFTDFIFKHLQDGQVGIGGYGEERSLYSRSNLFEGEEPRSVHLGIDIWTNAGTEVHCPVDATVHSYANRNVHGDYGPVIILQHDINGFVFYTLYGHLAQKSLVGLCKGKTIQQGENFAWLGRYEENFHWPPHLHFQLIIDIQGFEGDYPGVCKKSEAEEYLNNCPDPSVFL